MHSGPAGHDRCPKYFRGCARLLVKEQQVTMTTWPFLSSGVLSSRWFSKTGVWQLRHAQIPVALLSWDMKTWQSSGSQDRMHDYINCPGSTIIIVTIVTRNKLFWVLTAADRSTVHRRWKSLNTNAHCAQTNRQKKMVYAPKWSE